MVSDRTVQPGWYGFDFDARTELARWEAFRKPIKDRLIVRTTWSTPEWSALLIEVKAPIEWTYPGGLPKRAPKGRMTTLQDLTGEPDVSPGLAVMGEQVLGRVTEAGGAVVSAAGRASTAILFAAVLVAGAYVLTARR